MKSANFLDQIQKVYGQNNAAAKDVMDNVQSGLA
jgi:hypothetical protein